jgi:hypothetical protein
MVAFAHSPSRRWFGKRRYGRHLSWCSKPSPWLSSGIAQSFHSRLRSIVTLGRVSSLYGANPYGCPLIPPPPIPCIISREPSGPHVSVCLPLLYMPDRHFSASRQASVDVHAEIGCGGSNVRRSAVSVDRGCSPSCYSIITEGCVKSMNQSANPPRGIILMTTTLCVVSAPFYFLISTTLRPSFHM